MGQQVSFGKAPKDPEVLKKTTMCSENHFLVSGQLLILPESEQVASRILEVCPHGGILWHRLGDDLST
jgi:hypothetical protein